MIKITNDLKGFTLEDYQKIYDKTVEKQEGLGIMRKESRGR